LYPLAAQEGQREIEAVNLTPPVFLEVASWEVVYGVGLLWWGPWLGSWRPWSVAAPRTRGDGLFLSGAGTSKSVCFLHPWGWPPSEWPGGSHIIRSTQSRLACRLPLIPLARQ
jgi:hypothetical protein